MIVSQHVDGDVSMTRKITPERLFFFSDGVFAVLITILVLELHPPAQPTFETGALVQLVELRRQLPLHRDGVGQPSLPFAPRH